MGEERVGDAVSAIASRRLDRLEDFLPRGPVSAEDYISAKHALRWEYSRAYPEKWVASSELAPIFLLAVGKCGTTTATHLLNLPRDVWAYHELAPRLWTATDAARKTPESPVWGALWWNARADILSVISNIGGTFAECNHRLWPLMPSLALAFPQARFLYIIRDLDSSVRSMVNWGWYSRHDRAGIGRPGNPGVNDVRELCAWSWCVGNETIVRLLARLEPWRYAVLPFTAIAHGKLSDLSLMYRDLGIDQPPTEQISLVLDQKHNRQRQKTAVENIWESYKEWENKIFDRVADLTYDKRRAA
jgi:hypothetical protein